LTEAASTPVCAFSSRSARPTQEAQVIPSSFSRRSVVVSLLGIVNVSGVVKVSGMKSSFDPIT
jgi:hypothetical protein